MEKKYVALKTFESIVEGDIIIAEETERLAALVGVAYLREEPFQVSDLPKAKRARKADDGEADPR